MSEGEFETSLDNLDSSFRRSLRLLERQYKLGRSNILKGG